MKNPTRATYWSMRQRCENPKSTGWKHYGGRGIKVCERWKNYHNFANDMGERPPGLTLERINNNGDYEPSNCKWATRGEQARNRRNIVLIEHNGRKLCIADWAKETGLMAWTISKRVSAGMPASEIFKAYTPHRMISFRGKTQSTVDWAAELGIKRSTILARLNAGWTPNEALGSPVTFHRQNRPRRSNGTFVHGITA